MISLEINYDIIIKATDIHSLETAHPGIYVLLGSENKPYYVGQSVDVGARVRDHFTRSSELSSTAEHYTKVGLIFESDLIKRMTAEFYLINLFNTPQNFRLNLFYQCKAKRNDGNKCKAVAHTNGFCTVHGGNGETLDSIRRRSVKTIRHLL